MGEVVWVLLWRLGESLGHPFIKHSVTPNQQEKENKTEPIYLPQKQTNKNIPSFLSEIEGKQTELNGNQIC